MFSQAGVFSFAVALSMVLAIESSANPPVGGQSGSNSRSYYPPYGVVYPGFVQYPGYIPIGYPYPSPATVAATTTRPATVTTGRPLQPGVSTAYPLGAGVGFQRPGYFPQYPAAAAGQYPYFGRK